MNGTESRGTLTRKGETKGTDGGTSERVLEKAEKWRNVDSGKKERQRDGWEQGVEFPVDHCHAARSQYKYLNASPGLPLALLYGCPTAVTCLSRLFSHVQSREGRALTRARKGRRDTRDETEGIIDDTAAWIIPRASARVCFLLQEARSQSQLRTRINTLHREGRKMGMVGNKEKSWQLGNQGKSESERGRKTEARYVVCVWST